MKGLTNDFIAIDTNVFGHLINSRVNTGNHIHKLLRVPPEERGAITLLVDAGGEIQGEYRVHLRPDHLRASDRLDEAQIMKYWMSLVPREKVTVNEKEPLWNAISKILIEQNEPTDRIFVYVAFKKDRILISNDRRHIINRRARFQACRDCGCCGEGADVMCSREAYERISD